MNKNDEVLYLTMDTEHGGFRGRNEALTLLQAYFGVLDSEFKLIESLELEVIPNDGVVIVTGEALDVNKIDLIRHAKIAIPYKKAIPQVHDFINKWKKKNKGDARLIPVGHNVQGDIDLVCENIAAPNVWNQNVSYQILDTARIAAFLRRKGKIPHEVGCSLVRLCKHFDIPIIGAHTAAGDSLATAKLLKVFLEDPSI